jgi:hypothetical protein
MKTLEETRAEIIQMASSWGNAFATGDSRTGNRLNRKIGQIMEKYREDREQSESLLLPCLAHANPSVRLMASVWALELGIHTQEAETILTRIKNDQTIGLVSMMAVIHLSKWNDKKAGRSKTSAGA